MARPLRIERPGAWHHVTARGNEQRDIYRDNRDRRHFCELLGEAVETFGWLLHAYVLMDNHFHLLVETPEANLGRGMQWLNTSYCVWFNRRHQRAGHLLQGRFKSIVVDPTGWALEVSRYIHLNPVRIGSLGLDKSSRQNDRLGAGAEPDLEQIRARITRLRHHRWSSYRAYAGLAKAPKWLRPQRIIELGGFKQNKSAVTYRHYVESAVRQGLPESPWESLKDRAILGTTRFVKEMVKHLDADRKPGDGPPRQPRFTISEIMAAVERTKKQKWSEFHDKHGDWGRDVAFYMGRKDGALTLQELGQAAQISAMAVSMAVKRVTARIPTDPSLAKALQQCRTQLLNV